MSSSHITSQTLVVVKFPEYFLSHENVKLSQILEKFMVFRDQSSWWLSTNQMQDPARVHFSASSKIYSKLNLGETPALSGRQIKRCK